MIQRRTKRPRALVPSPKYSGRDGQRRRCNSSDPFRAYSATLRERQSCLGLTLIEVIMSTLLTGVVMVAALNSLGAATKGSLEGSRRGQAITLAAELMAEVLDQPYHEPVDTVEFGPETGEATSTRADFDDIDDYDHWTGGPPQNKAGDVLPNRTGWSRSVLVHHMKQSDVTVENSDTNDEGVKRVTVNVYYNGDLAETLAVWTSVSWPPVSE